MHSAFGFCLANHVGRSEMTVEINIEMSGSRANICIYRACRLPIIEKRENSRNANMHVYIQKPMSIKEAMTHELVPYAMRKCAVYYENGSTEIILPNFGHLLTNRDSYTNSNLKIKPLYCIILNWPNCTQQIIVLIIFKCLFSFYTCSMQNIQVSASIFKPTQPPINISLYSTHLLLICLRQIKTDPSF